jgi:membrane-bound ClpP family serine protease
MTDRVRSRCSCSRCTIRGLMGPAVVITIGVLFLLQGMRHGSFDVSNTYPVILIVIGAVSLASALAPTDGHISGTAPLAGVAGSTGSRPNAPENPLRGQGQ